MLTSKEVLEKTGISRATLNNYISWGLVPRPDVLPPEPHDGAAPRIGYFADEIVQRIEEIQRLKRDGWSIAKLTEHFIGKQTRAVVGGQPATAPRLAQAPGEPARNAMPRLSIEESDYPAYLVNDRFEVLWLNNAVASGTWPELPQVPAEAVSQNLFRYLLRGGTAGAEPRDTLLRFHLGVAKHRGASFPDLCRDLPHEEMAVLERHYAEAKQIAPGPVAQTRIPAVRDGAAQPASLYAVHFREGLLFLYVPAGTLEEVPLLPAPRSGLAGDGERRRMPTLTEVAVLVTDLQHSSVLWSELPAEEYFELINQIWLTVDPIFRRHGGTHGKHPGEGMVCYFFPQPDSSYLWNALLAAHQMREAIHRVSKEWQLRKGWTTELYLNTGIDEGREWLGTYRAGAQLELIVLGDAVAHATRISDFSRAGAIWVTRNVVGKLRPEERQRLQYGVRRRKHDGHEVFVPSTFSRAHSLADPNGEEAENLSAIARLPIAEVIDIAPETGFADRTAGRNST